MKASHAFLLVLIGLTGSLQSQETWKADPEATAAAARLDAALDRAIEVHEQDRKKRWPDMKPVTAPPVADDATFLRRCCVDIAGRLPTAQELQDFSTDPTADKRNHLITRLSAEPAAAERRFLRLADILRLKDSLFGVSQQPYLDWVLTACQEDRSFQEIVNQLLTAKGSLKDNPATGFILRDYGCAQVTATEASRAFLGEDIHCAACHDHPFADTTQRQYYELAAAFSVTRAVTPQAASPVTKPKTLLPGARPLGKKARDQVASGPPAVWQTLDTLPAPKATLAFSRLYLNDKPAGMTLPSVYWYRDGKPGDPVDPKILPLKPRQLLTSPHQSIDRALSRGPDTREHLAQWFTDGNHQRLSKTSALRVWSWMFGVPSVPLSRAKHLREGPTSRPTPQQVIQLRSCESPPSTSLDLGEELHWLSEDSAGFVAALCTEFEHCGHRLGRFQLILAHTQAYQREAMTQPGVDGFGQFQFLPAPLVRRMPEDVVWDALVSYLARDQRTRSQEQTSTLPQVLPEDHCLRILGRGTREWADEDMPSISHNLARMMIADPMIQKATVQDSRLISDAMAEAPPAAQVDRLFIDVLSRKPRDSERNAALAADWDAPGTALPDIAWALLNTREFLFHH